MRYFCPKCTSVCKNKIPNAIFLELKCIKCGHSWFDRKENYRSVAVDTTELLNAGAEHD